MPVYGNAEFMRLARANGSRIDSRPPYLLELQITQRRSFMSTSVANASLARRPLSRRLQTSNQKLCKDITGGLNALLADVLVSTSRPRTSIGT